METNGKKIKVKSWAVVFKEMSITNNVISNQGIGSYGYAVFRTLKEAKKRIFESISPQNLKIIPCSIVLNDKTKKAVKHG